jgi:hypothetical protein
MPFQLMMMGCHFVLLMANVNNDDGEWDINDQRLSQKQDADDTYVRRTVRHSPSVSRFSQSHPSIHNFRVGGGLFGGVNENTSLEELRISIRSKIVLMWQS